MNSAQEFFDVILWPRMILSSQQSEVYSFSTSSNLNFVMLAKVSPSLDVKTIQETKRKVSLKLALVLGIFPTIWLILAHIQF